MGMATVLSVFFIPVLYYAIEKLKEKWKRPRAVPISAPSPQADQRGGKEGESS